MTLKNMFMILVPVIIIIIGIALYFIEGSHQATQPANTSKTSNIHQNSIIANRTLNASANGTNSHNTITNQSKSNPQSAYNKALAACANAGISQSQCQNYCTNNPSKCGISGLQGSGGNYSQGSGGNSSQGGTFGLNSNLPSCSNSTLLTMPPVPLSNLYYIIPLGNLNPTKAHVFPTDHIYPNFNPSNSNISIFAPGNVTITSIQRFRYSNLPGVSEYTIDFSSCRNVSFYYNHVSSLSPKLSNLTQNYDTCVNFTTGGTTFNRCDKNTPIKINAGDLIGWKSSTPLPGTGNSLGIDLGAYDFGLKPLAYANSSRYQNKLYAVCPLNYFIPSVKSTLLPYLGKYSQKRTVQPLCGQVDQDIPGMAQGDWFSKGIKTTQWAEDTFIALVHDNINPQIGAFSIGPSANLSGLGVGPYTFTPTNSGYVNRDFSNITADGNVYCYNSFISSNQQGIQNPIIILQMLNSNTLRIEGQMQSSCGLGPWTFTTNHLDFVR